MVAAKRHAAIGGLVAVLSVAACGDRAPPALWPEPPPPTLAKPIGVEDPEGMDATAKAEAEAAAAAEAEAAAQAAAQAEAEAAKRAKLPRQTLGEDVTESGSDTGDGSGSGSESGP